MIVSVVVVAVLVLVVAIGGSILAYRALAAGPEDPQPLTSSASPAAYAEGHPGEQGVDPHDLDVLDVLDASDAPAARDVPIGSHPAGSQFERSADPGSRHGPPPMDG
ncbi:hypothetical protein ACTXKZ_10750 [Brachybacterium alimentarium]|uniref:hypothetical protein n=1 Tax=Brachybacterium alimentarium TaxID=47845 RepID=UPI003FD4DB49